MSQLRRRNFNKSSVNGYVSDGLVFHLDSSDALANSWTDRVGGVVFDLYGTELLNGGVYFGEDNGIYGHSDDYVNVPYTAGTIEIVAAGTGQSKYCIFAQPQSYDIGYGISFIVYRNDYISLCQGPRHKRYYSPNNGLHTMSVSMDKMYKDRVEQSESGEDSFSNPATAHGCYLGCGGSSDYYRYTGTIYQIRIYNRILTEDEVIKNQSIDINRYNIVN